MNYEELKWSLGEKYEQSTKADREKYLENANANANANENANDNSNNNSSDYNQMKSLLFEDGTESCMRVSNKREDANTKLNERSMIESINQNPFLPRNNYINDLQVQDEFLKPRNSNTTF